MPKSKSVYTPKPSRDSKVYIIYVDGPTDDIIEVATDVTYKVTQKGNSMRIIVNNGGRSRSFKACDRSHHAIYIDGTMSFVHEYRWPAEPHKRLAWYLGFGKRTLFEDRETLKEYIDRNYADNKSVYYIGGCGYDLYYLSYKNPDGIWLKRTIGCYITDKTFKAKVDEIIKVACKPAYKLGETFVNMLKNDIIEPDGVDYISTYESLMMVFNSIKHYYINSRIMRINMFKADSRTAETDTGVSDADSCIIMLNTIDFMKRRGYSKEIDAIKRAYIEMNSYVCDADSTYDEFIECIGWIDEEFNKNFNKLIHIAEGYKID